MTDIYFGLIIVYCFSLALLLAGVKIARSCPKWTVLLLMLFVVTLMFLTGRNWHDDLHLAQALPLSNLIVIADVLPLEAGLMIGLAWPLIPGLWRKALVIVPMTFLCLYQANWPLTARPPLVGDHWRDGVCYQTTQASCGPAAAATLLQSYDIPATEKEMAQLCLTTTKGTSMLGLYRGLKLKTRDSANYDVQPFSGNITDLQNSGISPILLSVGLPSGSENINPAYTQQWGWIPGVSHTVVLFRFLGNDKIEIGDPSTGRETWSIDDLAVLWRGTGLYLKPRTR